jgi:hypothetical protein
VWPSRTDDYPTTDVDGMSADPFSFGVAAFKSGSRVARWKPLGVVFNGETMSAVEEDLLGAGHLLEHATARSYATWKGETAAGDLWVEAVTLASNVRCSLRTVWVGKGKNATSSFVTEVSGSIDVALGRDPMIPADPENPEWEYVWWEGHFYDVNSGALSERFTYNNGSGSQTLSLTMPADWSGGFVAFVVDYMVPSASVAPSAGSNHNAIANYVYNPELNGVPTTAGHAGGAWSNLQPSTSVGDGRYPLARSAAFDVSCN